MSGTDTPPITYTDEAMIVQPDDWNELVTLFVALQARVTILEAFHT